MHGTDVGRVVHEVTWRTGRRRGHVMHGIDMGHDVTWRTGRRRGHVMQGGPARHEREAWFRGWHEVT